MSDTSFLSRVIFREHSDTNTTLAGTYNLLMRATDIPSPMKPRSTVKCTTLEDDAETFKQGIRQTSQSDIKGNLEKKYADAVKAIGNKSVDLIYLYGEDGLGGVEKITFTGQVDYSVGDVGGVDAILTMSATVTPNTVPISVVDLFTVTAGANGVYTVAAKA
jgi:hypothetical protein